MDKIREIIKKHISELSCEKKLEGKRIYLFGANAYVEYVNNVFYGEGYRLWGIIDNDKEKQGKKKCNILISDPESIDWKYDDIVIIISKHMDSMKKQIQQLSKEVEVFVLVDFENYIINQRKEDEFWCEEKYELEMKKLYKGAEVYYKIKEKGNLLIFLSALGDIFAGGLYLHEYEKKIKSEDIKLVVASNGVYKVAQLFGINNIAIISKLEMDLLIKFIFWSGKGKENICFCVNALDTMAGYKKIPFPRFWARYYLGLNSDSRVSFPSIYDKELEETNLKKIGIVKGKTVILAPYANSIDELPWQFWDLLAEKIREKGYYVFTNIAGVQKPISGSIGVQIPLYQIGNYLEYAGYFISLRSGLCDVAGHSKCKKIIIFRDRNISGKCSQIDFFDLRTVNISKDAIQYKYDDNDFKKNISEVMDKLLWT